MEQFLNLPVIIFLLDFFKCPVVKKAWLTRAHTATSRCTTAVRDVIGANVHEARCEIRELWEGWEGWEGRDGGDDLTRAC